MNPKYPIFIVSKNRANNGLTWKALDEMNVPYRVIIEEEQFEDYAKVINEKKLLILDKKYQNDYETLDNLCFSKSIGPGAARNFAWDLSIKEGFAWHWVMDDNLDAFHRVNRNEKWECRSGSIFLAMEDFCERFENVAIAGPNYYSFVKATDAVPPYVLNTRIYSCNLIRNDIPFRWRGRYNEDTDLSLRVLKSGLCTIQFNAFLQGKVTTQRMSGGNTEDFYKDEGTFFKSKMLADNHLDVANVVWKFNRYHHHVNYKKFNQSLIYRKDYEKKIGVNNYGMKLIIKEK